MTPELIAGFWSEELRRSHALFDKCLAQSNEFVDRIAALERVSEGKHQDTVAVGVVPNRVDGLLSLHIGRAYIELSSKEARDLAWEIKGKAFPILDPK